MNIGFFELSVISILATRLIVSIYWCVISNGASTFPMSFTKRLMYMIYLPMLRWNEGGYSDIPRETLKLIARSWRLEQILCWLLLAVAIASIPLRPFIG